MYEANVSLSTVLITTLASVAALVAVAIGVGVLHHRWALAGGILVLAAHGIAVHTWIVRSRQRERHAAYMQSVEPTGPPSVP